MQKLVILRHQPTKDIFSRMKMRSGRNDLAARRTQENSNRSVVDQNRVGALVQRLSMEKTQQYEKSPQKKLNGDKEVKEFSGNLTVTEAM